LLADPPFNLLLHQAPNAGISQGEWPGLSKDYHWHLELLPVLTRVAGFEYGTGFYINPVPPEAAAEFLLGQKIT
jgi:UDPglucose--hexose-1-phosphate uridylyltransferase